MLQEQLSNAAIETQRSTVEAHKEVIPATKLTDLYRRTSLST